MGRASISVVMPMFNEEENIAHALAQAVAALEVHAPRFEIIVVDDASTDGSPGIVRAIAERDPRIRVLRHDRNRRLGATLRTGFAAARMDLVLYMDADLPFDPYEIGRAVRAMEVTRADVVAAFRHDRTGEGPRRAIYSYAYNALIGLLFGIPHRDVNFAFKLVRREVLAAVELRSEGSLISAELLVKARNLGFDVQQIGVDYFPRTRGRSTLASGAVIVKILRELASLYGDMRAPGRPRAAPRWRAPVTVALALALLTFLSRVPFASGHLWAHDSVLYARALEGGFHVGSGLWEQRPHAPGYLFYVAAAQLVRGIASDPNAALVLVSMIASAASAACIYLFGLRFARPAVAALTAAAFALSPLVWTYGAVAYPYALLALASTALAWLMHARGATVATGLAFGAAAGFRQDLLVLLAPLWLWSLRDAPWGARVRATGAIAVGSLAWLVPTALLSDGALAYAATLFGQLGSVSGGSSVLTHGAEALAANLALTAGSIAWGLLALLPVTLALVAASAAVAVARRALRPTRDDLFLTLWTVPGVTAFVLVHIGEPGHVLSVLPGIYVAVAYLLERALRSVPMRAPRPALAACAVALVAAQAGTFLFGAQPASASALERREREIAARTAYVRATFPPRSTVIIAREDFLQVRYYLPEYRVWYHDPQPFRPGSTVRKRTKRITALVVFTDGLRARDGSAARRVDLGGGVQLVHVALEPGSVVELAGDEYAVRPPVPEEELLSRPRRP